MGNKIANEADARSTAVELLERILLKGTNSAFLKPRKTSPEIAVTALDLWFQGRHSQGQ